MKNKVFLFLSIMITGMAFISSCSSSDTVDPVDVKPTINFIGGTGYISANATVPAGSAIKMGINAFANSTSNAKLVKLTITRIFNNNPFIVLDSVINVNSYSLSITTEARSEVGPETWFFKITDKDNQTNEISLIITTESTAGPINTFTMKILGAQNAVAGSSFASIDGSVYTLAQAKANQAKVDLMYYSGDTDFETIAAPDDPHALLVFTNPDNGLAKWSIRNPTRFKLITEPVVWASITDDEFIVQQAATGVTESRISKPYIAAGNYLSFIAASGKKGIIKIESIVAGKTGEITISVKVQQ